MSYVYCFFGATATSLPAVLATAALAAYLANVAPSGGVTLVPGMAYVVSVAPMTAPEAAAWQAAHGATSYQLLGNFNGYYKHLNVEFVAL